MSVSSNEILLFTNLFRLVANIPPSNKSWVELFAKNPTHDCRRLSVVHVIHCIVLIHIPPFNFTGIHICFTLISDFTSMYVVSLALQPMHMQEFVSPNFGSVLTVVPSFGTIQFQFIPKCLNVLIFKHCTSLHSSIDRFTVFWPLFLLK